MLALALLGFREMYPRPLTVPAMEVDRHSKEPDSEQQKENHWALQKECLRVHWHQAVRGLSARQLMVLATGIPWVRN